MVTKNIDINGKLTDEQRRMLEGLKSRAIEHDEDNPELTPEQLKQFRRVSETNREERIKQTVSIRLSPQAIRKAKSLGKGYTSVLSRILENALGDNDLIKHYL